MAGQGWEAALPSRSAARALLVKIDQSITEIVETEGHLIDSRLMTEIFDSVVKHGGSFEVFEFTIGRTNDDFSRLQMRVAAPSAGRRCRPARRAAAVSGAGRQRENDAELQPAPTDGCAPDDFYSTSNHHTWVRHRRPMGRGRAPAHGRGDRDRARPRRLPKAARSPCRRSGRLFPRRHPRRA